MGSYLSKETTLLNGFNTIEVKVLPDGSLVCGLMYKSEVQVEDSLYTSQGGGGILLMRLQETGTGLKPVQQNKSFSFEVYPNPAHNSVQVNINLENNNELLLQIFDITGRCVLNVNHKNSKQTIILDISKLKAGLYFIKVSAVNQLGVKKLVVF